MSKAPRSDAIQPVIGKRGEMLVEMSRQAYKLIQVIELERSGIRDGDGSWHGSDALDGTIHNLKRLFDDEDSCPRCGAHMQATHHPACAARDGTPTELDDKTDRAMTGTPIAEVADDAPPWMDEKYDPPDRRSKEGLLAHYATREPKSFIQFDGWYGGKWQGDSVINTDEAGRSMISGLTTELMNGADMRLLIKPDSDPTEIVALLHNAIASIESMPENIATSHWLGSSLHLVEPREDDAEFERITNKLETALESTDHGWGTPLGELVGGEVKDMLKDGRAWSETDRDIEWMRAAEAKFDQYCRSL